MSSLLEQAYAGALKENEVLKAQVTAIVSLTKELAHDAFWAASDINRADRDSDTFDSDVRQQFENKWSDNDKNTNLPDMCLREMQARAIELFVTKLTASFPNGMSISAVLACAERHNMLLRNGGDV